MKLKEGRYQFVYNVGNGDMRIFDIFSDGRIKVRHGKTGDIEFVSTNEALRYLEPMLILAEKEKEKFKNVNIYDKISKTKFDMLLTIKNFMLDNPIEKSEIRYY
jgi:hypothetical protein